MSLTLNLEGKKVIDDFLFWDRNITHNYVPMAKALGCYGEIWRPDESGIAIASQMVPVLRKALDEFFGDKFSEMKTHEPSNGWGSCDGFHSFLEEYLQACLDNPQAKVIVASR